MQLTLQKILYSFPVVLLWNTCTCCYLKTALATLSTTWFTLVDRRWRSWYRSSDQCILNAFRSPERYNGWFREQLGQRFTFLNFFPMMTDNANKKKEWTQKWPYKKDVLGRVSTLWEQDIFWWDDVRIILDQHA